MSMPAFEASANALRYTAVQRTRSRVCLPGVCARVPITSVEVKLNGEWLPLKRTVNNQWPYYNTNGPWQSSFPMPIRVTSVTGETIEDSITSTKGGEGTKQVSGTAGSGTAGSVRASIPAFCLPHQAAILCLVLGRRLADAYHCWLHRGEHKQDLPR